MSLLDVEPNRPHFKRMLKCLCTCSCWSNVSSERIRLAMPRQSGNWADMSSNVFANRTETDIEYCIDMPPNEERRLHPSKFSALFM